MSKIFKTSDYIFFIAALLSLMLSVVLWFTGNREEGVFVGLWVPSILILGVYAKIIVLLKQS